jgi:adenylate cyclase, class 2
MYEVEMKFPVDDLSMIEAKLARLEVSISEARVEVDTYFNHPSRDFAKTDEAVRLRRVGEINRITYKGPKVDQTTKTRSEIDLALPEGAETFEAWITLLRALGFTPVGEVRKERRKAFVPWQGRTIEVSLDWLERLGTFVELELIVPPEQFDTAKACLQSLADELGLSKSERRSYLNLLLEK